MAETKTPSTAAIPCIFPGFNAYVIDSSELFVRPIYAFCTGGESDTGSRRRRGRREMRSDELDVGDWKQSQSAVVLSLEPVLIQTSNNRHDVALSAFHTHSAAV